MGVELPGARLVVLGGMANSLDRPGARSGRWRGTPRQYHNSFFAETRVQTMPWVAQLPGARLVLVGVANSLDLTKRALPALKARRGTSK